MGCSSNISCISSCSRIAVIVVVMVGSRALEPDFQFLSALQGKSGKAARNSQSRHQVRTAPTLQKPSQAIVANALFFAAVATTSQLIAAAAAAAALDTLNYTFF